MSYPPSLLLKPLFFGKFLCRRTYRWLEHGSLAPTGGLSYKWRHQTASWPPDARLLTLRTLAFPPTLPLPRPQPLPTRSLAGSHRQCVRSSPSTCESFLSFARRGTLDLKGACFPRGPPRRGAALFASATSPLHARSSLPLLIAAPPSLIFSRLSGQAGVQIGNACWELYTLERASSLLTPAG